MADLDYDDYDEDVCCICEESLDNCFDRNQKYEKDYERDDDECCFCRSVICAECLDQDLSYKNDSSWLDEEYPFCEECDEKWKKINSKKSNL